MKAKFAANPSTSLSNERRHVFYFRRISLLRPSLSSRQYHGNKSPVRFFQGRGRRRRELDGKECLVAFLLFAFCFLLYIAIDHWNEHWLRSDSAHMGFSVTKSQDTTGRAAEWQPSSFLMCEWWSPQTWRKLAKSKSQQSGAPWWSPLWPTKNGCWNYPSHLGIVLQTLPPSHPPSLQSTRYCSRFPSASQTRSTGKDPPSCRTTPVMIGTEVIFSWVSPSASRVRASPWKWRRWWFLVLDGVLFVVISLLGDGLNQHQVLRQNQHQKIFDFATSWRTLTGAFFPAFLSSLKLRN